jgi:hypothetical protein
MGGWMDMVTKWLVTQQLTILTLAIDAIIDVTKQLARNVRLDILQDFRMQSLESDHFRKQHEQHEIEEVNFTSGPLDEAAAGVAKAGSCGFLVHCM